MTGDPVASWPPPVVDCLMPHMFGALWHLACVSEDARRNGQHDGARATDVFAHGYAHLRDPIVKWTPQRVAVVLRGLRHRGLVAGELDGGSMRWSITTAGWRVLAP